MAIFFIFLALIVVVVNTVSSFRIYHHKPNFLLQSTWQEDFDHFLNWGTSCKERIFLTRDIISKVGDITTDVVTAVQERNMEKLAPRTLGYGKAIQGLKTFQNQVVADIIPDILSKAVPRLVEDGPKLISKIIERAPTEIAKTGQKALSTAKEMVQDPSLIRSSVQELKREITNVFRSSPIGLEEPHFDVLRTTRDFQVRRMAPYSVCTTLLSSGLKEMDEEARTAENFAENVGSFDLLSDPLVSSASYLRLIRYFFGENTRDQSPSVSSTAASSLSPNRVPVIFGRGERLSMATPIIVDANTMSIVLPRPVDSSNAPFPTSDKLSLKDFPGEIVAVRQFSGLVTEGEVIRQKMKLEDALMSQNIDYDPSSFKVLQYNPPYALPWIRRNEISVKLNRWDTN